MTATDFTWTVHREMCGSQSGMCLVLGLPSGGGGGGRRGERATKCVCTSNYWVCSETKSHGRSCQIKVISKLHFGGIVTFHSCFVAASS